MKLIKTKNESAHKSLTELVSKMKRKKIASKKIVSLEEYRASKQSEQAYSILVVDDDEMMRQALERILQAEGYTVFLASDGMELSEVLEKKPIDAILMDVNLPWLNGLELCSIIREQPHLSDLPVIMVSANREANDIRQGLEAGANDYIGKPFDIDHMIQVLDKNLKKSS